MKNSGFSRFLSGLSGFLTLTWAFSVFGHTPKKYSEMNFFQKSGYLMTVGFLCFMGFITLAAQRRDHTYGKNAFENQSVPAAGAVSGNDKFRVIAVYESDSSAESKLSEAFRNHNLPVISQNPETSGRRTIYDAGLRKVGNLPPVKFWQKFERNPDTFEFRFLGASKSSAIYTVFKAPNAIEKLRKWIKDNGYTNPQFEMEYEQGWGEHNTYTKEFNSSKSGSKLSIVAFFNGRNGLYMWDGEKVYDCSGGANTQVQDVGAMKQYVGWLEGLGQ